MKHHRISAQVSMAHLFLVHVLHGFQDLKGRKGACLDTQKKSCGGTVVKKCWHPLNTTKLMAKLSALLAMAMHLKCYETKQQNYAKLKLSEIMCGPLCLKFSPIPRPRHISRHISAGSSPSSMDTILPFSSVAILYRFQQGATGA